MSEHADLRRLPVLDGADVARLLPYLELVDGLEEGHRQAAPIVRRTLFGPDGSDQSFLGLPAWRPGEVLGVKLVTVFPANMAIPTVQALYVLFDGRDGGPLALLDGTELTYRKTACDSALGSRFLSRTDSHVLLVVGRAGSPPTSSKPTASCGRRSTRCCCGTAAETAPPRWPRPRSGGGRRHRGPRWIEADIICTATMTKDPLVGRRLRPGTHLDLVGAFQPDHREVDDEAVVRADLYVDTREVTTEEDGDLVIPLGPGLITLDDIRGDLFELCRDEVPGRTDQRHHAVRERRRRSPRPDDGAVRLAAVRRFR